MPESWTEFFSSEHFMPHGHCYLWQPALVWLQVASNGSIAAAYIAIFATLVYLVRRIEDIPFQWMYVAFAVFIVTCGFTHLFDVYVIWNPEYWLDGVVRAVTAVASVGTAILLPPLVPKAVALAEAARVSHERGIKLEAANRELAVLLDRAKELEELKTNFFANVSHELRTPLALILGPVEKLLGATNLDHEQRRDLEVVGRNARTLLKHVNDLLDVSKLEAGKLQVEYSDVDLAHIVRLVAANFDGVARERSIDYVVDAPEKLRAHADADKFQRVALNLLSNAFKFTPSGGRIRCSIRPGADAAKLVLEVADSGPGVRPEQREVIFERFRQLDGGATRAFGGTGLGLAIAKDFVELHAGTISVGSAPEGGALFSVELPRFLAEGAPPEPAKTQASANQAAILQQAVEELRSRIDSVAASGGGERPLVLVVEDNPEMNRFVRESLAHEYRVESAFDGREGIAKAEQLGPDLILSDVMMPHVSGEELVGRLRAEPALDSVPIVLLTAKADDELRVKLLREGAQDYLMKPFSVEELRARVHNLVTAKRARDVLQAEIESQVKDLESLAKEVTGRKRELETAMASLRVAREHAERASQLKTNFLGMVSHELRTPITAFQLQLERLRRSGEASLSPEQQQIVQRMSASATRLATLIESLLNYTRMEAGRLTVDIQDVDASQLASEVVSEAQQLALAKGLDLQLRVSPDLPPLRSDPQLIRLILSNLVGNAVKFTEKGGVEVVVARAEGEHHILVKDSGPGIAARDQQRIFAPFEHLEPTRSKHTPGIGLGLALVREMVSALGGSLDVDSELGRGSSFRVRLPSGGPAQARASARA